MKAADARINNLMVKASWLWLEIKEFLVSKTNILFKLTLYGYTHYYSVF